MKIRRLLLQILGLSLALPVGAHAARVTSDLQPAQKRQTTVVTAERLAQRNTPAPLPAELPSPFNPPDFDKPEAIDAPANPMQSAGPTQAPRVLGDREILEVLAVQLTPTGTIQIGDSPRPVLVMGSKRFEVGTRFTVTYNNQDYELELVAIERTTFTLRYRGEELTRPIKSVR